jgi:hypothetical protein
MVLGTLFFSFGFLQNFSLFFTCTEHCPFILFPPYTSSTFLQPLSVEQPLQASGWSSRKKILVFGGIALIAALIAILLFTQFGGGARTTRDLARVEDENSSPIPSKSPSKPNKKEADTDDDYDEYDKKPDPKEEEKEKEKASKDDDDDDDDDDEEEEKSEAREKIQEEADYDYGALYAAFVYV